LIKFEKRIKPSNEEKSLLSALKKFTKPLQELNDDAKILKALKREFVNPKANKEKPLRKSESIELIKLLDRVHLIEVINNMVVPVLKINAGSLREHEIKDPQTKQLIKLDDLNNKSPVAFNQMLYDLKMNWIESDFKLSNEQLLSKINEETIQNYFIKKRERKHSTK
jgi:hypothetical protein